MKQEFRNTQKDVPEGFTRRIRLESNTAAITTPSKSESRESVRQLLPISRAL